MTQAATGAGPRPARSIVNRFTLYFFGALGGILFGYDLGVIAGILVEFPKSWHLTGLDKGIITASLSVGAIFGALVAAQLNTRFGRRRTIMAAAVIVMLGTVVCILSPGADAVTVGRLVLGVGIGCSSATVPTYLSELAPARLRGAMAGLNQIFIVSGILIAFLVDYWLSSTGDWRGMFSGALVPAVILFAGMYFLPETPRWLLARGRDEEARAVLVSAHGSAADVAAEVEAIREVIRLDTERASRWRDLWAPWVRPMLLVALLLAAGQQFGGVNAVNAYFPTMLVSLGFATRTSLLSAVILGATKLVFTAWCVFVVDRWGRKPLLVIGSVIMAVTLVTAGFVLTDVHGKNTVGILTLILMVLYLVGYELGWGAVVWVMMAEVFPLRARAAGMGLATVVLWASTGIVTAGFPIVSDKNHLGLGHTMWLFAAINVVLLGLVIKLVPETKGRSLEQIELDLRGRSTRTGTAAKV